MVKSDTYAVIFYSLLQLSTSWADDSHEHVHIKLHLPEVVRKHTHMKMIYKHHFHPKKIKFHDHHVFDALPLLGRPFRAAEVPDLFKLGIKSQIVDIKKPKIKFPKFNHWELDNSVTSYPSFGKYSKFKNSLQNNFHIKMPEFDFSDDIRPYQKLGALVDDEDELLPIRSDQHIPIDFGLYDSNLSHSEAIYSPQWSHFGSKSQDILPGLQWPISSNDWTDTLNTRYPFRSHSENDEKITKALETFSTKSNFDPALDVPLDLFEKAQKLRGNHRFRGSKTRI